MSLISIENVKSLSSLHPVLSVGEEVVGEEVVGDAEGQFSHVNTQMSLSSVFVPLLSGYLNDFLQAFVILAGFFSFVVNSAQLVAVISLISTENVKALSSLHPEPPVGLSVEVLVGVSVGGSLRILLGAFEGDAEGQFSHVNTQMSLSSVLVPLLSGYLNIFLQAFVILLGFFSFVVNSPC